MGDPFDKRTADAADATNAIDQRIFETSIAPILVVDRQGNFIRVSPGSLPILGCRPANMIARSAIGFVYPPSTISAKRCVPHAVAGS